MSKELMQERIERAQAEIDQKKNIVAQGKMRQRYHFMGQAGWINDAEIQWAQGFEDLDLGALFAG